MYSCLPLMLTLFVAVPLLAATAVGLRWAYLKLQRSWNQHLLLN